MAKNQLLKLEPRSCTKANHIVGILVRSKYNNVKQVGKATAAINRLLNI
jgi:hypothetical protein